MKKTLVILLLLVLVVSACTAAVESPPEDPALPQDNATPTAVPSPTPTEVPPVVLTVCTASLPETLFPYAGQASAAKDRVLNLLYPPAVDEQDGQLLPLALAKLPTEDDGDLRLEPVPIRRGQTVVDARGELVTAIEGVRVRPSGCRAADCAITWNGIEPLEMDQMVIDFTLRDGLTWPDGTPVRAADAVFSYRLASDAASPALGWREARTQGLSALDERMVSWRGYPGFANPNPAQFFWLPLPASSFDAGAGFEAVATDPLWASTPTAYGPFAVSVWTADELRLVRVPGHPLGADLLPGVDQVLMRPIPGGAAAGWDALQDGACDVLDASFRLADEPELMAAIAAQGGFDLHLQESGAWTQLVFGMRPAEYDALANPVFAQRPDYFADARTRLGITQCLDRKPWRPPPAPGFGRASCRRMSRRWRQASLMTRWPALTCWRRSAGATTTITRPRRAWPRTC
jgi:peptide/nickel transport system substrate-binding protein